MIMIIIIIIIIMIVVFPDLSVFLLAPASLPPSVTHACRPILRLYYILPGIVYASLYIVVFVICVFIIYSSVFSTLGPARVQAHPASSGVRGREMHYMFLNNILCS